MIRFSVSFLILASSFVLSCNDEPKTTATDEQKKPDSIAVKGSYAYDRDFLKKHTKKIVELQDQEGRSKILLSADYQGRVMTSSATGDSGTSFGWINYDLISTGSFKPQFNAVGGEERFWLGPEGGQYALYFKPKDSFVISKWQVPPVIDTLMYETVSSTSSEAVFWKKATLTNYSGTVFDISIERKIRMLDKAGMSERLGTAIPAGVSGVAFETVNQIRNEGTADWKKEKGLISIWLLGMFTPSPKTTVVIPFQPVKNARAHITDTYFGKIPAERLQIKDSVLYFTCDGKFRSKLGLSPLIAKGIAGSFDFEKNVLTLISFPVQKNGRYVNSKWELQKEPYKGDVVNSYNDGPLADGSQLGPFYEIESSSPASELKKGEVQSYTQSTFHFQGDYESMRALAQKLLNVDLNELKK
jgi:hypothetical protein